LCGYEGAKQGTGGGRKKVTRINVIKGPVEGGREKAGKKRGKKGEKKKKKRGRGIPPKNPRDPKEQIPYKAAMGARGRVTQNAQQKTKKMGKTQKNNQMWWWLEGKKG